MWQTGMVNYSANMRFGLCSCFILFCIEKRNESKVAAEIRKFSEEPARNGSTAVSICCSITRLRISDNQLGDLRWLQSFRCKSVKGYIKSKFLYGIQNHRIRKIFPPSGGGGGGGCMMKPLVLLTWRKTVFLNENSVLGLCAVWAETVWRLVFGKVIYFG